jgi:arylsulfatase
MNRIMPFAALCFALVITGPPVSAQDKLDRTVLPIAEPKPPTYTELDARKAKPPARFEVKAPKGAPTS